MAKKKTPAEWTGRDLALEAAKIIEKKLSRFDRGVFRKELAMMMGCAPTPEAMFAFAQKSPDRWAQAVTLLAQLGGFEKGINVNLNVKDVTGMSDVELLAYRREMAAQVAALARGAAGEIVDAEILPPRSLPAQVTAVPEPERPEASRTQTVAADPPTHPEKDTA